jgi:myosin heavy subunit
LLKDHDPVSMHFLMETALSDSQQYEVLPFEEADDLKKQLALLSGRIEAKKRKLRLEITLCDASVSLNRLHTANVGESATRIPGNSPQRHPSSRIGSRGSHGDLLSQTDGEVARSTRKCEDLAQELWKLETSAQELQRRLLEHTAGVLQLTHKGFLAKELQPPSPESIPEYRNDLGISRFLDGSHDFDDRSFYQALDTMLDIDEQENKVARPQPTEEFAQQTRTILETERRLEDLNQRLRNSISETSATFHRVPVPPARGPEMTEDPIYALEEQLNYLEKGVGAVQEDQNDALRDAKHTIFAIEERLEDLSAQLHRMITRNNQDHNRQYPSPPEMSGQNPEAQLGYLQQGLDTVEQTMQRLAEASFAMSSRSAAHEEKAEQFETVFMGLWDIMATGEEGSNGPQPTRGRFSLQEFSAKVQALYGRATGLQEQKEILARQIQQQRELNSKSEAEKDARFTELTLELDQTKQSLEKRCEELKKSKEETNLLMDRLDEVQQEMTLRDQRRVLDESNALQAEKEVRIEMQQQLHAEIQKKEDEITKLQASLQALEDSSGSSHVELLGKLELAENRIQDISSQRDTLHEAIERHQANEEILQQNVEQKAQEAQSAQEETRKLETELVHLRTEVTVARAELDGAYGTRAQRAAEVASNPALQKELEELTAKNSILVGELAALKIQHEGGGKGSADLTRRVEILQQELTETIIEYEVLTRSSLEFEKEREQLERVIDGLRDRCESLESELSDEKIRWLGVRSPGSSGAKDASVPGTTSTMVLKNEFKKIMRETRAENMKALRVRPALEFASAMLIRA